MERKNNPLPQLTPLRFRKLREKLQNSRWKSVSDLSVTGSPVLDDHVACEQARALSFSPVQRFECFGQGGNSWEQRWMKIDIPALDPKDVIPAAEVVVQAEADFEVGRTYKRYLHWDCDGEATVYIDGEPWAGLDVGHRQCPLPDEACSLWIDVGLWQTGIWVPGANGPITERGAEFRGAEIVMRDPIAWALHFDLEILDQLTTQMLEQDQLKIGKQNSFNDPVINCSPRTRVFLQAMEDICNSYVDGGYQAAYETSRRFYKSMPAEAWQPIAALCGHAHIDLVWLWPELATEKKGVHSFATLLRMMEMYPEITFVQSQPALYRAIERRSPALMKQMQERIDEGRWEVMGGFEVEPDVNIPSGEALARSLIYGQRKIAQLKGEPSKVCWIPDVFGYSNCLPQILKLGGIEYFYTTKMTWSMVTRFPYNSFIWKGSDGSEILSHLCTFGYNSDVHVGELNFAMREFRQSAVHNELLLPQGWGDGGGGVSMEQCERARRIRNMASAPKTQWTTSEPFFDRLQSIRDQLPVYQGELYLEYHRGTYTSQSDFKRLYRACERALQTHEAVNVVTGAGPIGEEAWLRVLFAQFHDAIPGSSIKLVYDQMNPEYEAIVTREQEAAKAAYSSALPGHDAVIFNPIAQTRSVVINDVERGPALLEIPGLSALSVNDVIDPHDTSDALKAVSTRGFSNAWCSAGFDEKGQLVSLKYRNEEQLIEPAGFVLCHDEPHAYDAWEIDHYTVATGERVATDMPLSLIENTPVRAVLQGSTKISDVSSMTVRYILEMDNPALKIEVDMDWQETHRLLRYHVPTRYMGHHARYGAPFGAIDRPQLPGDESDTAMFEVPAARWAAVKDDQDHGLALITEAKYGFNCFEGTLGVSLLKSAIYPDETQDKGTHEMRFAIADYVGTARTHAQKVPLTAEMSDWLYGDLLSMEAGQVVDGPFTMGGRQGGLCIAWVTPAETCDGYVIRLHETAGMASSMVLNFNQVPSALQYVDFNEQCILEKQIEAESQVKVTANPYEVLSLLVTRG